MVLSRRLKWLMVVLIPRGYPADRFALFLAPSFLSLESFTYALDKSTPRAHPTRKRAS